MSPLDSSSGEKHIPLKDLPVEFQREYTKLLPSRLQPRANRSDHHDLARFFDETMGKLKEIVNGLPEEQINTAVERLARFRRPSLLFRYRVPEKGINSQE